MEDGGGCVAMHALSGLPCIVRSVYDKEGRAWFDFLIIKKLNKFKFRS